MPKVALIPYLTELGDMVRRYRFTDDLNEIYSTDPKLAIVGESRDHVLSLLHQHYPVDENGFSRLVPEHGDWIRVVDTPVSEASTIEELVQDLARVPGHKAYWRGLRGCYCNEEELLKLGIVKPPAFAFNIFELNYKIAASRLKRICTKKLQKYKRGTLLTSFEIVRLTYCCHKAICAHIGITLYAGKQGRYKADKIAKFNAAYMAVKKAGALNFLRKDEFWRNRICNAYKYIEGLRKASEEPDSIWEDIADVVAHEAKVMGVRRQAEKEVREEQKGLNDELRVICRRISD